ncbi:hypothetical protein HMF7854_02345 [Sphingomonas ginkgonis]|uniref:Uncharacterized protein n=1 Tax=Sphingomonas ginkgonis TaxID=2315330 RepID=A0A3S0EKL0_9SPHN|nr:hypothetical protein [Sphingomonas ginkgonis]RST29793.1 hypothetical protein HMF7854_02345 [Sphingomonas ginkgonis]
MGFFPRPASPRDAIADLLTVMRRRSRTQWLGVAFALLATAIVLILFYVDPQVNTAPPRTITFVDSWPANRTDAQIEADQKKDQAAREKAAKAKQAEFQKIQKSFGM